MLPLLSRMQRCGLLGRSGTLKPPLNWKALRADLQLIDPRANELRSDKVAHDIHLLVPYLMGNGLRHLNADVASIPIVAMLHSRSA